MLPDLILYTDGSCEPNPGPAGYGFVVCDRRDEEEDVGFGYIGEATNNVAEYTAVLAGLAHIKNRYPSQGLSVLVRADSRLVVEQLAGRWRVTKTHLGTLNKEILRLAGDFKEVGYEWIPRERNVRADALSKRGRCDRPAGEGASLDAGGSGRAGLRAAPTPRAALSVLGQPFTGRSQPLGLCVPGA